MKEVIEIVIREDGLQISSAFKPGKEFLAQPVTDLGSRLMSYCSPRNPASLEVFFYLSEDLLFFKKFSLPLQTQNLKEAINYQLEAFTPFEGKMVHSFVATRDKKGYNVCLYAAQEEAIVPLLVEIAARGFKLAGLFPESQRYVTGKNKKEWALLLPGRFPKLLVFSGPRMKDRLLCHTEPSPEELAALCPDGPAYRPDPAEQSGFRDAAVLLKAKAHHKEFNLLPASYRRPDYLRQALIGLCLLNICALLATGGIKEYNVLTAVRKLAAEITTLQPTVKEVSELRIQDKQLSEAVGRIEGLGANFDIIRFLEKVTKTLPTNSYLDQMRMDEKTGDMQLQGYTTDVAALTAKLETLGNAKLKSTSRRKNQTYFDVEISTP